MSNRGWVYCDGKIIGFMTYQIYGKSLNVPYMDSFNGGIGNYVVPINYINNKLVLDFDSVDSHKEEILNYFVSSSSFISMPETHLTKLLR